MGSLIQELSNLCNLFPLEFKMTQGDQILSLISMKRSPNWLLKGGVSAGEYFSYLVLKQCDFGENWKSITVQG